MKCSARLVSFLVKGSLFVAISAVNFSLTAPAAWAQRSTASINGSVKDSTGAVIPEATVVLTNTATNVASTATTNASGDYVILNILPGQYTLRASKQGFETVTQAEFTLDVNQTTTFDFTLPIGSAMQSVTVEATASHVETSTSELGTVVTQTMVNDLPLNGRNFTQLLELTPGVSPISVAQNSGGWTAQPVGAFTFPSVNGQTNRSNLFMLDGINNQGSFESTYAIAPQIDDIQEFKVQSHNDEAQFGGALGAVVNVVTKGGTNGFHGDGFEFLRNDVLDARNFFTPPTQTITPYKQNQFGGTIAGPVIIPHLYNGRDKTFFYASYEGFRNHSASTSSPYRVPTAAELSGDLSDFTDTKGNLIPIYNPYSTRPDPNHPGYSLVDPFPNNQIPANLINQSMVKYAQAVFPAPIDIGVPGFNGLNASNQILRQDLASIRFDQQLSAKDTIFVRYTGVTQPFKGTGPFAGTLNNVYFHGYNGAASWIHTFSGTGVAQFTFGRNSMEYNNPTTFANVPATLATQLGFSPNFVSPFIGGATLLPSIGLGTPNFPSFGDGISNSHTSNVTEVKGDISLIRGRHTFKGGVDFATNNFEALYLNNNVSFASTATSCSFCYSAAQGAAPGGIGLASFLLNVPDNAGLRNVHETEHGGWVDGFYFQDQWKATDRLTLNLGLRYDVTLIPIYGNNQENTNTTGDVNFNNGTYIIQKLPPACSSTVGAPCIPGGTLPDHVVVTPHSNHSIFNNTYDNWQPRLGLAYRVKPTLVARAGYGRFFENWAAITQTAQNTEGSWPQLGQLLAQNLNKNEVPTVSVFDPFPGTSMPAPTPFASSGFVQWYMNPLQKNPYSDQWNLGLEKQIGTNDVVSANYVGARSERLDLGGFYNVAMTPGPGDAATVASRQPYPYIPPTFYDRDTGHSNYNAFQFSFNRRASSGLSYILSYTYSKNMSVGCDGWYGVEGCSIQDPYHPQHDYSVAGFDLTHILSFSWVYPVPIGTGKRFSTHSRALDYTLGNWEFNGIFFTSSGQPFSIGVNGDIANTGCGCDRANLVQGVAAFESTKNPSQWLNPAAFAAPAAYTFGNTGRNAFRADWPRNFDLSFFRVFPITESKRVEFRAELFNAFNTPTFGIPDSNISDGTFGQVFYTANAARIIQMALKLYF